MDFHGIFMSTSIILLSSNRKKWITCRVLWDHYFINGKNIQVKWRHNVIVTWLFKQDMTRCGDYIHPIWKNCWGRSQEFRFKPAPQRQSEGKRQPMLRTKYPRCWKHGVLPTCPSGCILQWTWGQVFLNFSGALNQTNTKQWIFKLRTVWGSLSYAIWPWGK
jgi:hypothetical protein